MVFLLKKKRKGSDRRRKFKDRRGYALETENVKNSKAVAVLEIFFAKLFLTYSKKPLQKVIAEVTEKLINAV